MTDKNDNGSMPEHESQLMDSLLHHALSDDRARMEQQIQRLRTSIHAAEPTTKRGALLRTRWLPVSAAAILVAVIFLAPWSSRNGALAAVERSLRAEQLPIDRQYEVVISTPDMAGDARTFTVDLYVRQERTVIHTAPDHDLGEVWIYADGDRRWIVPASGPARLRGPEVTPRHQLVGGPPLVISTILQRLRDGHDLERLPVQVLEGLRPGDPPVACDHVIGVRRSSTSPWLPQRVEFWSDQERGIVHRLTAEFRATAMLDAMTVSARLVGTPELPHEFFDHHAFHEPDREMVGQ